MTKNLTSRIAILICVLFCFSFQTDNDWKDMTSKDVAALFAKYPTKKSNLGPSDVEWDNPVYKSIADTVLHYPVCVFMIYTKQHQLEQDSLQKAEANKGNKKVRTGILSTWHCVPGQPNVIPVYAEANNEIGKSHTIYEIVFGHVQAWILCAYSPIAAIFSNVPDFNAGMEYQGQNIGTEIWTETHTRYLIDKYDSIYIWGGCVGSKAKYTHKGITVTVPEYYWKIIKYGNNTECWLMPNSPSEGYDMITQRVSTVDNLIAKLKFDPTKVLNQN